MQKLSLGVCAIVFATHIPSLGQLATAQDVSSSLSPSGASVAPALPTATADDVVPAGDLEQAFSELEAAHAQNYNALQSVLDKVPANVRPTIEQAMENSRRGWQRAKENHDRISSHRAMKRQEQMSRAQNGQQSSRVSSPGQTTRLENTSRGQGNAAFNSPTLRSADTRNDPAAQGRNGEIGGANSPSPSSASGRTIPAASKRK